MPVSIAVGISDEPDSIAAFGQAADQAARELEGDCDLAILFVAAPHLAHARAILEIVHERLGPRALIGCGAGGVLGAGRELERGPGAAVWALSAAEAMIETHHFEVDPDGDELTLSGLPGPDTGEALIVLADPYTFSAEALLTHLNAERPEMPVLGGLASAIAGGSAVLFCDREIFPGGAVACSLSGVALTPCVSQGATPVGPEMTITRAHGNQIEELASRPAIERLREAIAALPAREQALAAQGLMLGVVIDENQPEYERGDFLVRPIIGAQGGALAIGELVRVGQTVRMHVRDAATADEDLREALRLQREPLGSGAAGALVFTCNGRGSRMFAVPDHDAAAVDEALGAPAAGFFCAGEIGPVGGRNFLHGFTATIAVFSRN